MSRDWPKRNPEKHAARVRRWRKANPLKTAAIQKRASAKRLANDGDDVRARDRASYAAKNKRPRIVAANRRRALLREYRLTEEQFAALVLSQQGRCAVCREVLVLWTRRTHVDHDHKTGLVRAILCNLCNCGIGSLRDSAQLLLKAAAYMVKHELRQFRAQSHAWFQKAA